MWFVWSLSQALNVMHLADGTNPVHLNSRFHTILNMSESSVGSRAVKPLMPSYSNRYVSAFATSVDKSDSNTSYLIGTLGAFEYSHCDLIRQAIRIVARFFSWMETSTRCVLQFKFVRHSNLSLERSLVSKIWFRYDFTMLTNSDQRLIQTRIDMVRFLMPTVYAFDLRKRTELPKAIQILDEI
jgi:hypothetical protein